MRTQGIQSVQDISGANRVLQTSGILRGSGNRGGRYKVLTQKVNALTEMKGVRDGALGN